MLKYLLLPNRDMMKTIQTVVEELPEQRAIFDENLLLMADAQNFVVSSCYDHEETNTFRMHHFNYPVLRERFGQCSTQVLPIQVLELEP